MDALHLLFISVVCTCRLYGNSGDPGEVSRSVEPLVYPGLTEC